MSGLTGGLRAASAGDAFGVSTAMYETKYFFGTGPDAHTRIGRHHKALTRNLAAQCEALGERLPDGSMPPPSTVAWGAPGKM